jgi:tRNA threonylcarbamoyl adenosine modification protein YjeE
VIEFVRECDSLEMTGALAAALAAVLRPGDRVALRGDLGAGKTTLVRMIAESLGADPGLVSSPTFVIVNQYPARGAEVVHADFYRLHSAEDLEVAGWDRLTGPTSIVLAEWPERAPGALGGEGTFAEVELRAVGREAREVRVKLPEAWRGRPGVAEVASRPPVVCRVTGRLVSPLAASYPFADDRARMADLGKWFSGGYTVSRDVSQEDLEEG